MSLRRRRAYHEAGHTTAALTFGIPIITVTIENDRPHLLRGHYHVPDADFGLKSMVTLCLAGPKAEREFCGPINDGSDQTDYQMAENYLSGQFGPLQIASEFERLRDAARRLVRSPWARHRICLLADALLRHSALTGEQILEISC